MLQLPELDEVAHAFGVAEQRVVRQKAEPGKRALHVTRYLGGSEGAVALQDVGPRVEPEVEARMRAAEIRGVELLEIGLLLIGRRTDAPEIEAAIRLRHTVTPSCPGCRWRPRRRSNPTRRRHRTCPTRSPRASATSSCRS